MEVLGGGDGDGPECGDSESPGADDRGGHWLLGTVFDAGLTGVPLLGTPGAEGPPAD